MIRQFLPPYLLGYIPAFFMIAYSVRAKETWSWRRVLGISALLALLWPLLFMAALP